MSMLDDTLMDNIPECRSRNRESAVSTTPQPRQLEAYFERNVDDVGTDKGLTCPLYIQELDCTVNTHTVNSHNNHHFSLLVKVTYS